MLATHTGSSSMRCASAPKPWMDTPTDVGGLRRFLTRYPACRTQLVETLRRAPDSYAHVHYYSNTVIQFIADDGVDRFVKFRMVDAEDPNESGLPDAQDIAAPWEQERRPGAVQPYSYLKEEFAERVRTVGVRRKLQVQVFEPRDPVDQPVYDPARVWDLPWLDVAHLTFDEVLSSTVCEQLRFNVATLPRSFAIPPADSLDDTRSVAAVRAKVYTFVQDRRWTMYFLRDFGSTNRRFFRRWAQGSKPEDVHRRDPTLVDILRQQLWFDTKN